MRVEFSVFYFLCCNGSLHNELTLKMQNIDITQSTTAQLRFKKKELKTKLQQKDE